MSRFLCVDLDLESETDLGDLIAAMTPGAFAVSEESSGGTRRATLELCESMDSANSSMTHFVEIVRNLSDVARMSWNSAMKRRFNVGLQLDSGTHEFSVELDPATVRAVADVGASIEVTVYGGP